MEFLVSVYPWTKALHLISVISWMAGLFYLPRLFVYHADQEAGSVASEMLKVMERRLLRVIMNPAMVATWGFGIVLAATPGVVDWAGDGWFHVKLAAILVLTWVHHWLARRMKEFQRDGNTHAAQIYRMMNEVPTLGMVVIVIMVIVKPF